MWYTDIMVARNEGNRSEMKALFKAWCARRGYKASRTVDSLSAVGDACLRIQRGLYTIEVATPVEPGSSLAQYTTATHGYGYPLLDAPESRALAFLKA